MILVRIEACVAKREQHEAVQNGDTQIYRIQIFKAWL